MKRNQIPSISVVTLNEIASKCMIGRGKNWIDYQKLIEELNKIEPQFVNASTPNSLDDILADVRKKRKKRIVSKYAKNKDELAGCLGITRQTLYRWEKEGVLSLKKDIIQRNVRLYGFNRGYDVDYVIWQLANYNSKLRRNYSDLSY